MRKVYIVSGSNHDFTRARAYGELVFLSEGPMNRYSVNNMYRIFKSKMSDSAPDDYILVCGLAIMNAVAASIMTAKHGRVNYLLYEKGGYLERNIVI